MDSDSKLSKVDWEVRTIPLSLAQELVKKYHYSKGCSNTAVYRHGLFYKGQSECLGTALWLPPTKAAAVATFPSNHNGVLSLSRLVLKPEVPKNGASFFMASSMRLIDRVRWPCLVTYADEWQGHTGAIYKATNWTYVGLTKPTECYVKDGRMLARKAGPKTRTRKEMEALGAIMLGKFAKHKFIHIK